MSARLVVCIPTYRRPVQLEALLRALDRQVIAEPFDVLIGNNDAASPVAEMARRACPSAATLTEIAVADRGVTAVRNAMLAAILARDPAADWIACLDDDQLPAADWLDQLVGVGRRYAADLVGGPVAQVAAARTFWAAGATSTEYLPTAEGPVDLLNEAGNLLLSTAFLRTLDRPAFSADFGRTGGEDYEFFLHARSRGARIVWAANAHVTEIIPRDRLTLHGLIARAHSTSAYQTRAALRYAPAGKVIGALATSAVKLPGAVLRALARQRSGRLAAAILVRRLSGVAGGVAGLWDRKVERYGGEG